jgi:hypothetical protein
MRLCKPDKATDLFQFASIVPLAIEGDLLKAEQTGKRGGGAESDVGIEHANVNRRIQRRRDCLGSEADTCDLGGGTVMHDTLRLGARPMTKAWLPLLLLEFH